MSCLRHHQSRQCSPSGRYVLMCKQKPSDIPEDVDRRFIISFYLADDSISIYEPAQKNSGIIEGKFLHRNRYKNIDNNNAWITPSDMAIGGDVKINGHSFHIMTCDDYTSNYLGGHLV